MHKSPVPTCLIIDVENIFDVLETVAMRLRNTRAARGIRGRRGGSHCAAPLRAATLPRAGAVCVATRVDVKST